MPSLETELQRFAAVIVTGGSSGIGKSFIELIRKLHPTVPICNLSRRVPLINILKPELCQVTCDFSDRAALSTATGSVLNFLQTAAPSGPVLLINNSGFGAYGHFPEPDLSRQLAMIDVNVVAVVELTARLLPVLKARGGAIITVASIAAYQPSPYLATYGATKAFVLHWSLSLHEELRGTGVRTLAVCPGPTSTGFFQAAGLKTDSVAEGMAQATEPVVWAALRALAAGRTVVVPGLKNWLMTAVASRLPKPWVARISARLLARFRLSRVKR